MDFFRASRAAVGGGLTSRPEQDYLSFDEGAAVSRSRRLVFAVCLMKLLWSRRYGYTATFSESETTGSTVLKLGLDRLVAPWDMDMSDT